MPLISNIPAAFAPLSGVLSGAMFAAIVPSWQPVMESEKPGWWWEQQGDLKFEMTCGGFVNSVSRLAAIPRISAASVSPRPDETTPGACAAVITGAGVSVFTHPGRFLL